VARRYPQIRRATTTRPKGVQLPAIVGLAEGGHWAAVLQHMKRFYAKQYVNSVHINIVLAMAVDNNGAVKSLLETCSPV
jgi:hypothetical protein